MHSGVELEVVDDFDTASKKFQSAKFDKSKQPTQPSIFVLSSGMFVENTPSWMTAANLVFNPENLILILGYCDPITTDGELLAQEKYTKFDFKALRFSN
jgi:Cft2 family RNA processing exonuclease